MPDTPWTPQQIVDAYQDRELLSTFLHRALTQSSVPDLPESERAYKVSIAQVYATLIAGLDS